MNQSKARGTFEQRKAQSIERKQKADLRLEEIEAAQAEIKRQIEANMIPVERDKRMKSRLKFAQMAAISSQWLDENTFVYKNYR